MSSAEAKRLAHIVKGTHKRLRKRYRQGHDETEVWRSHIQQEAELGTYASAMHDLATKHWESSQNVNTSRVAWVNSAILQYYKEGEMTRITQKELRKLTHLGLELENKAADFSDDAYNLKWKLLDVGSCYNPFSVFKHFDVTAIDLYPAQPSVKKCDFLSVELLQEKSSASKDEEKTVEFLQEDLPASDEGKHRTIDEDEHIEPPSKVLRLTTESVENRENVVDPLPRDIAKSVSTDYDEVSEVVNVREAIENPPGNGDHICTGNSESVEIDQSKPITENMIKCLITELYDVVVFCLLLEYIPSPKQRFICCQKAYDLLKPNGLLCIITPDSKHQNANVHLYKLWKITLGFLGFSRVKYEKLSHFHGMIFRKGLCKKAWELDAERELNCIKNTNVKSKFETINYDNIMSEMYIPQDFQDLSDSEDDSQG